MKSHFMRLDRIVMAFMICACSQSCSAGTTNAVEIVQALDGAKGDWLNGVGRALSERSRGSAEEKLKSFRDLGKAVTLQEFLGGDIRTMEITFYGGHLNNLNRAGALVKELMASDIVHGNNAGPGLQPYWAESVRATIRGRIRYTDGRASRFECAATEDGNHRAAGAYLFFEDHDGIEWWNRWDPAFPPIAFGVHRDELPELIGKWADAFQTNTSLCISSTNFIISAGQSQEIWDFVPTTNRFGAFASRNGVTNEVSWCAGGSCDKVIYLGDRHWCVNPSETSRTSSGAGSPR